MKRFALAIILLTAAGVAVFLALNWPRAEASPDVTITVNSTFWGVGPDTYLTLPEAMKLATGELSLGALTGAECAQVSGVGWVLPSGPCWSSSPPGAASADTIVFDTSVFPLSSPKTIYLDDPLPVLDTGDDTVDGSGAGVIVTGGAYDCFEITSDYNTIKGMEIYHCENGVVIYSGWHNVIGGSAPGERNVISGHDEAGVKIVGMGGDVWYNSVVGNYIGTNAAGDAAMPNEVGVHIFVEAENNMIGGRDPGDGNVISGNSEVGVRIGHPTARGNRVWGNCIGTDASGTSALPNDVGGVEISSEADLNHIGSGSDAPGKKSNTIAFNGDYGVRVTGDGTRSPIRRNSIHSNGGKGIETVNGGNEELPPPTITGVASVMGTACANCTIDIFSDDEDEGRVYEGSTTADSGGNWSFSGTPEGPNVTATATDDHNTSEFSAPMAVPEPTPSPTPTPSATPTPSPTPTVGPTRSLFWGPGWHNVTWSGASTPEEAFACAAGNYAAAYRLVSGGWERYFPDRPDLSNMTDLAQYDAFLILVTSDVTCEMEVADPPSTERTLDWGVGWQNEGWTGADGMPPEDVFDCAEGSYAAAYRLVGGGWERYFPDRPEISNMGPLDEYDAFLILVTAPVSCTMTIAP
ncbi:MAG: right-handed parallel beta-helix repeat-containing protein [Dehalococcoidia bacterium]